MMTKTMKARLLVIGALLFFPVLAWSQTADQGAADLSFNVMDTAMAGIATSLQKIGIKLFFALTMLQLVITGYGQVASGELDIGMAKWGKALIWTSFCLWLMTNDTASNFIGNTVQYFLSHAIGWATNQQGVNFDVNSIIQVGIDSMGNVIQAAKTSASASADSNPSFLSALIHPQQTALSVVLGSLLLGLIVIIVLVTCGYVALKVFMVKIEAALVLAIMPLSLSFLGLSAMRDQGFAPFKSMLALIYRIVILGMIVGGMAKIGAAVNNYANNTSGTNPLYILLVAVFGFVIMAFLAHKSDQIASSLASGSANLGSGDAIGTAAAAAAAAGVVAAAGAAATGGAAPVASSMSEMMKGMTEGGGQITNASITGGGDSPAPAPGKPGGASAESPKGPPKREDYQSSPSSAAAPAESGSAMPPAGAPAESSSPTAGGTSTGGASQSAPALSENGGGGAQPQAAANDGSQTSSGSGLDAGIGGAPQRDLADQVGNLVDAMNAPKREAPADEAKRHLGTLAQHGSQEGGATHVSINTGQHE